MFTKILLSTALLAIGVAAHAQQPSQAPLPVALPVSSLTSEQQAQLAKQNQQIEQAALQVAQMIDQNKAAEVWSGASSVGKQASPEYTFVNTISTDRKDLGTVKSRAARSVSRTLSNGSKIPAGAYINVLFASRFANASEQVRELVSFHLDPDKIWRVAGYAIER